MRSRARLMRHAGKCMKNEHGKENMTPDLMVGFYTVLKLPAASCRESSILKVELFILIAR